MGARRSSAFSLHSEVGSSLTEPTPPMALLGSVVSAGQVRFTRSNRQSAVEKASALSECVLSVLRWTSSANEFPSSWARRLVPGVRSR